MPPNDHSIGHLAGDGRGMTPELHARLERACADDAAAIEVPEVEGQPPPPYWLLTGRSETWYALVAGHLLEISGECVEVRAPYRGESVGCEGVLLAHRAQAVAYASWMIAGGPADEETLYRVGVAAAAALRGEI